MWCAALAIAVLALACPGAADAQAKVPEPEPPETQPRGWLLVTGGLLFTIGYAWAASSAAFGEPSRFDNKEFGSPGLLYVPIIGPILFDADFCSEASDHYQNVEPNNAIDRQEYCGNIGALLMTLPQVLGASMFAFGFAFPQEKTAKHASSRFGVLPRLTEKQIRFDLFARF